MARNGNHTPKPEPVWIALGIVVFAMVLSQPQKRRRQFIDALSALADQHETAERVIAFGPRGHWSANMSQSIRGGVSWVRRLTVELERAAGS